MNQPNMTMANEIIVYHRKFPEEVQKVLEHLRDIILHAVLEPEEVISYQMPAFKKNGILVYYAAYKNHIGFYPTAEGINAFKSELTEYKWSKGAIQFPLDRPLPEDLITRIVQFKANANLQRTEKKRNKKS
jgi:uncharacterized protein YdhG (YjbR/CyaY superfamily)